MHNPLNINQSSFRAQQ